MSDENLAHATESEAAPHFPAPTHEMPFLSAARLGELCRDFLTICRATPQTEAQQYLAQRGISAATMQRAGIAYFPRHFYASVQHELHACATPAELQQGGFCDAQGRLSFIRHRLLFPFYVEGRALYLQARAISANVFPAWHKLRGDIPALYGLDTLAQVPSESYVYLVSGLMDALTLRAHGFHAVALAGADGLRRPSLPLLARFQIVAALREDAARADDLARYRALFATRGLLLPAIALGSDDVNQFFAARPTAALEWAILTDAAVNG